MRHCRGMLQHTGCLLTLTVQDRQTFLDRCLQRDAGESVSSAFRTLLKDNHQTMQLRPR